MTRTSTRSLLVFRLAGWQTACVVLVLVMGAAGALAATGVIGVAPTRPVHSATVARTRTGTRPVRKAARPSRTKRTRISRARFAALLAAGQRAAGKGNVNFGEILGIAAPGTGEMLRINSAWNNAKQIGASGIDFISGLLRSDAKAVRSISVQTLNLGGVSYIRPAVSTAKWTKELLTPTGVSTARFASHLLSLAKPNAVARISQGHAGSTYSIKLHVSELQMLTAFSSQLPAGALHSLDASSKRLLSGLTISIPKLVAKFDRRGRLTVLKAAGTVTETRADTTAQGRPYPHGGVAGVLLLHLVYRYGGALRIIAPPAGQILNGSSPLR